MGTSSQSDAARQRSAGCLSFETSALRRPRGQRCIALGSAKRLVSEAWASQSPCRNVFPFAGAQLPISLHPEGTAENEADIMTKVLSAVRHRELCKTDFDLDAVP